MMNKILMAITDRLPCRIISDTKNGDAPYLERYYLCSMFGWQFYIHRFVASDPDRGLHDHPWSRAFSIILSGWYREQKRDGLHTVRWFNSLTGDTFHRVILPTVRLPFTQEMTKEIPCWTLFFHSAKKVKKWGFIQDGEPFGWKPDSHVFLPHNYALEGKQDNWWLTAPKGKDEHRRLK